MQGCLQGWLALLIFVSRRDSEQMENDTRKVGIPDNRPQPFARVVRLL
jgi:hypothetical protein